MRQRPTPAHIRITSEMRKEPQLTFQKPASSRRLDRTTFAQIVPSSTCSHEENPNDYPSHSAALEPRGAGRTSADGCSAGTAAERGSGPRPGATDSPCRHGD